MSDSLTVLVSVCVGQSHCVSLFLVSFSLCRTVSLVCLCRTVYVLVSFSLCLQSHCVQSMSDSLTVLVYALLVSVYVGQSHCVGFSLCRTVSLC